MKAQREHEVPLSEVAIALLTAKPKVCDIVFAGRKGQPLSDMALTNVIRRLPALDVAEWVDVHGKRITVHGFRSTSRMWAAEGRNYPREVAEHWLAHRLPDTVERAYQRGSQFTKRTAVMDEWSAFCDTEKADTVAFPVRLAAA